MEKGIIFDIKRFAIHDGPGIRTTVFLKGCPCDCWWCHNPESKSSAILEIEKTIVLDGKTIKRIEKIGEEVTPDQVMNEIKKDEVFYHTSGGGVTFSGGEPMQQKTFLCEMLKACKQANIHTTLDTSAAYSKATIEEVMNDVDLFLLDLKFMNSTLHQKYIGIDNKQILENIAFLLNSDKKVWIRIPIITSINTDDIDDMIQFLLAHKKPQQINLLPYHNIGKNKYKKFGMKNRMQGIEEPSQIVMLELKDKFENQGFTTIIGG